MPIIGPIEPIRLSKDEYHHLDYEIMAIDKTVLFYMIRSENGPFRK